MARRFGKYELHRQIGAGGMGEVYAAVQDIEPGGRMVCALKVIRAVASNDATHRALFLREGELAARLRHGNIVPVFDVGEHDGLLYMAMELVDGVSLDRFLERIWARDSTQPSLAESVHIIRQVLRALHYVHTFAIDGVNQRIVHRDVSPQNIMITSSGEVRLTDFGIARVVNSQPTGRAYGKLAYMPREQYMGNPVQQSDLFAAGAVFYEMLTGHKLRDHCRALADFHEAIVVGRLPPLPTGLPSVVQEALAGMLEIDPILRAQSAKEILRQLGGFPQSGEPALDLEESYLEYVDSRHSWYTELTRQAKIPADSRRRSERKHRPRKRSRQARRPKGSVVFEIKLGHDSGAPVPGRTWELVRGHDAALDDVTTVPWARPLACVDTKELQP